MDRGGSDDQSWPSSTGPHTNKEKDRDEFSAKGQEMQLGLGEGLSIEMQFFRPVY